MFKKHVYCVFDTETAGHTGFPLIYDIGWTIVDRKGNIFTKKHHVIKEIYTNTKLMDNAYYGSKRGLYDLWLKIDYTTMKRFADVLAEFNRDLEAYKVTHLCAYNLEFDKRALISTSKYLHIEGKVIKKHVKLQCLWGMACELIASKPMYKAIAKREKWVSDKGNVRTGAEYLYRYISKEYNFIEQHTALDDSEIEVKILLQCLKQGKKYTRGILSQPWRLAQK